MIFGVVSTLLINFYTFSATAESFFKRPLTMIVPFGVGGPTDIIARHSEYAIERNSKLKIAVINQGGASGNIGMRSFTQKNKSLLLTSENILANKKYLTDSYPKEIENIVTPIYFFARAPFILYGHVKFDNINHLIQESTSREILFGSATPGSGGYESYNQLCNIKQILKKCRRVAYASSGSAILDLMAGRLDVFASLYANHDSFTSMNTVQPLLILSQNELEQLNNVPVSSKINIDVEVYNWYGLFHVGLSSEEVQVIKNSLELFFTKQKLNDLGYDMVNPEPFKFWNDQKKLYNEVLK
jgi:tripartite-type tricarboxylate transporter receptor subunit TctC